jgi:mono/diheme cytochrome c family protein
MNELKNGIYEREKADPTEAQRPWPWILGIALFTLSIWGVVYILLHTGDGDVGGGDSRSFPIEKQLAVETRASQTSGQQKSVDGETTYKNACQACHQVTGEGLAGAFPPLKNSEWLIQDELTPIRIVLSGLSGPITVSGQSFNSVMPAFRDQLSDDEIAAVLSFVRKSFGNQAGPVDASLVKSEREALKDKKDAWTAATLRP